MNSDLSAFYLAIRKDSLYCDPPSWTRRRACRTMLDQLFHCLTSWLAPILCFTAEEVWLSRFGDAESSVHLMPFAAPPAEWRDPRLGEKWESIRAVRRVVTGALEIERQEKNAIGSSLEAAPVVYVADPQMLTALEAIDLAEISITSDATVKTGAGPSEAFRLDEVKGVTARATSAAATVV